MNRSLRKLLSFSAAAAMLCNIPVMHAGAAYVAERVGDGDFDTLIRREGENILVGEGGDQSKLVVIDKDGTKRFTTLEESIRAIYPEASVGTDTYNFLSPTPAAYSFDFFDPAFRLSTEQAAMIAGTEDGKYALADLNGKLISAKYDVIVNMKNGYYEAVLVDGEICSVGVLGPDGKEILKPSASVNWVYLSKDAKFLLVCTPDGDYLTDQTGKKISKTYKSISGIAGMRSYYYYNGLKLSRGWTDSRSPVQEDWETKKKTFSWRSVTATVLDANVLRWGNENSEYAFSFTQTEPQTEFRSENRSYCPAAAEEGDFSSVCLLNNYGYGDTGYRSDGTVFRKKDPGDSEITDITRMDPVSLYEYAGDGAETVEHQYFYSWNRNRSEACYYDLDGNLLASGISSRTLGSFVIIQDDARKTRLYNAKFEPVGIYDNAEVKNNCVIAVSGDTRTVFDGYLRPFDAEHTATALALFDASGSVKTLDGGLLHAEKPGDDAYQLRLYNSQFDPVQTYTVTAEASERFESIDVSLGYDKKITVSIRTVTTDGGGNEQTGERTETFLYNAQGCRMIPLSIAPTAANCGAYFKIQTESGISLLDETGAAVLELPEEFSELTSFESESGLFYAAQADGYFRIYGSDLAVLQERIEGTVRSSCIYTDTADEESAHYGFYHPFDGVITQAVYAKPVKVGGHFGQAGYGRGDADNWRDETGYDYYAAADDSAGVAAIFDKTGKPVREFIGKYNYSYTFLPISRSYAFAPVTGSYTFEPLTGSVYTERNNGSRIVVKAVDRSTGREHATVYEPKTNTVIMETGDRFDKVGVYQDGYMVVTQFLQEGEKSLWVGPRAFARGLLSEDGTMLIQPTRNIQIGIAKYCHQSATPGRYDQRDYAIDSSYEAAVGEQPADDCFAVLTSYDYEYSAEPLYVPMKDFAPDYAAANGFDAAIRIRDGGYSVMKDSKWGIADETGRLLSGLKYDCIYEFTDGIAWTLTFRETETESSYLKDQNGNPLIYKVDELRRGLIAKDGRELLEPNADSKFFPMNSGCVERYENGFRTRTELDAEKQRFRYRDYKGTDLFNAFTAKYGYDSAVQHGKLWVVEKDGKKGVVTDDNSVVIPVEFADVLSFSAAAAENTRSPETLSEKSYTDPLVSLGNDTVLVSVRTDKDKIRAFIIKDDGLSALQPGDVNGDQEIGLDDVRMILKAYTGRIAGKDMQLTPEQLKAADVDENGEISVEDAQLVLAYYTEKTVAGKDITWDDLLKKK